jgi:hypothetical protein
MSVSTVADIMERDAPSIEPDVTRADVLAALQAAPTEE